MVVSSVLGSVCGECGAQVVAGACGPRSAALLWAGRPVFALRFCSWCPGCGAFGWGVKAHQPKQLTPQVLETLSWYEEELQIAVNDYQADLLKDLDIFTDFMLLDSDGSAHVPLAEDSARSRSQETSEEYWARERLNVPSNSGGSAPAAPAGDTSPDPISSEGLGFQVEAGLETASVGPGAASVQDPAVSIAHQVYSALIRCIGPIWEILDVKSQVALIQRWERACAIPRERWQRVWATENTGNGEIAASSGAGLFKFYTVSLKDGCNCPDAQKGRKSNQGAPLAWCKHRMALWAIYNPPAKAIRADLWA